MIPKGTFKARKTHNHEDQQKDFITPSNLVINRQMKFHGDSDAFIE